MVVDPLREVLRRHLKKDLRRDIPVTVWDFADRHHFGVADVLDDEEVGRPSLRKIDLYSQVPDEPRSLQKHEREELQWAVEDLEDSERYDELRTRIEDLLDFASEVRTAPSRPRAPAAPRAPTPYLDRMAMALAEPFGAESYGDAIALPPIFGEFRNGFIRIDAEPWVPPKTVDAYYRALQKSLGRPARKFLRESSLDVYVWTRRRREAFPNEKWREAMDAWNAESHPKKYKHESNFHKDYHRFEESVERAREQVADLRDEAMAVEAAEATQQQEEGSIRISRAVASKLAAAAVAHSL